MEENKFNWFDEETAKKITEDAKEAMNDLKKTWIHCLSTTSTQSKW